MTWIMTVAAGVALGYFLVQYASRNSRIAQKNADPATGTEQTNAQAVPAARLCKSRTDRKLAGVCGGIAEYLNADSTMIRLVTVLLVLGWGSGLLAYIVCALVMPEE